MSNFLTCITKQAKNCFYHDHHQCSQYRLTWSVSDTSEHNLPIACKEHPPPPPSSTLILKCIFGILSELIFPTSYTL
jgi:hypothetical protein